MRIPLDQAAESWRERAARFATEELIPWEVQAELNEGRLPPEVIKDLLQGQRDVAPAEYRDLVEAYYRAIADKARQPPPK